MPVLSAGSAGGHPVVSALLTACKVRVMSFGQSRHWLSKPGMGTKHSLMTRGKGSPRRADEMAKTDLWESEGQSSVLARTQLSSAVPCLCVSLQVCSKSPFPYPTMILHRFLLLTMTQLCFPWPSGSTHLGLAH